MVVKQFLFHSVARLLSLSAQLGGRLPVPSPGFLAFGNANNFQIIFHFVECILSAEPGSGLLM